VIAWRAPCGKCDACRRGDERRCSSAFATATRPRRAADGAKLSAVLRTGTFAPWCVVHESCAVPVDLPAEHACLLACGVMTGVGAALWATPVRPGSSVAVIGCGGVGLSVVQGARIAGAQRIVALDVDLAKLEQARALGATETLEAGDAAEVEPVDYAFSAVGAPAALAQAVKMLAFGGTATLVGVPPAGAGLDVDLERDLFHRKATIAVTHGGDSIPQRDFPELARLARDGKLDLASLVTKEIALDDVPEELGRPPQGVRTVVRL
jgi:Zn-dependent alcohol dehydrogenase